MISKLKEFMRQAGKMALDAKKKRHNHHTLYKGADTLSIVTEVDIAVSEAFKRFAAKEFADIDYLIIDEESVDKFGGNAFDKIYQSEYQLVIDPIDGTIHYANDIPLWGISIGVLRRGVPMSGIIYVPEMEEMVYYDGAKVVWLRHVFQDNEENILITPQQKSTSRLVAISQFNAVYNPNKNPKDYLVVDYFSAVVYFLFLVTGRIKSCYGRPYLWDFAGAWAACEYLGIKMYDYQNRLYLPELKPEAFLPNFKLKHTHVFCRGEDLSDMINLVS